jgi:hypothetical protein
MPDLPADEAFDPDALRVTTASGETLELVVVGGDRIDEDAYVDGRHGGRSQPLTLEGPGPSGGDGTYVYNATVSQSKNSETATIKLWLPDDLYPDQSVTVEEIEPVSMDSEP